MIMSLKLMRLTRLELGRLKILVLFCYVFVLSLLLLLLTALLLLCWQVQCGTHFMFGVLEAAEAKFRPNFVVV